MITTRKGQAPVPEVLPGAFFVLEFSRVADAFFLHVDDDDRSTYDLGDEVAQLQILFRTRTNAVNGGPLQPELIDRTIDIARELGMAQYIPTPGVLVEDRVLSIVPREVKQGLKFDEDEDQKNWTHGLRQRVGR
jgi:hypothetical protein